MLRALLDDAGSHSKSLASTVYVIFCRQVWQELRVHHGKMQRALFTGFSKLVRKVEGGFHHHSHHWAKNVAKRVHIARKAARKTALKVSSLMSQQQCLCNVTFIMKGVVICQAGTWACW